MTRPTPPLLFTPFLLGAVVLAVAASLAIGAGPVGPGRSLAAVLGGADAEARFVVTELRLPRTAVAAAVGLALGVTGAVLQSATRNVLADPELLGISGTASLVVVVAVAAGASASSVPVWWAVLGALGGVALALGAARLRGVGDDPVRLVLAGSAIALLMRSATALVMLLDQRTTDEVRAWVVGSVAGRDLGDLAAALPALVAGVVLAVLVSRPLSAMALGDGVARALGHRPVLTRVGAMAATALLVGAATALAGPLAFVGLVVPVVARALVGPDLRRVLPVSAVLGVVLLLTADVVSRVLVRPSEMPLGVVTALVGAPALVAVVRARRLPTL